MGYGSRLSSCLDSILQQVASSSFASARSLSDLMAIFSRAKLF